MRRLRLFLNDRHAPQLPIAPYPSIRRALADVGRSASPECVYQHMRRGRRTIVAPDASHPILVVDDPINGARCLCIPASASAKLMLLLRGDDGCEMAGEAIFVGYRRDDTADVAGRIYDAMAGRFGKQRVFKDVDNISPGVDFGDYIKTVLPRCRVALILIGPNWLESKDESGNLRLDDPHDWVRIEIETALATPGLLVVPVLVNGARMPRGDEVADSLKPLLRRNAATIRRDPDFHDDVARLASAIRSSVNTGILDLSGMGSKTGPAVPRKKSNRPLLWVGGAFATLTVVALVIFRPDSLLHFITQDVGHADSQVDTSPLSAQTSPAVANRDPANSGETALVGDPVRGLQAYEMYCQMCHGPNAAGTPMGPTLRGVPGRSAGTVPGQRYTDALRNSGITWSDDELIIFIDDASERVPGTTMPPVDPGTPQARADLVAYLKDL